MEGSLDTARRPDRAPRGPRHRQGVGALQAQGRPLGRSPPRARVAALHPRPQFSRRQPDRPGDRRAHQGGGARRRSAGDPADPRQPVSRKGPGRPRDSGAPGPPAAAEHPQAGTCQRPALPGTGLQERRLRRPRAVGIHRRPQARSRQPLRAVEPREDLRGTASVGRRLQDAAAPGGAGRPRASDARTSPSSGSSRTSAAPRL